ncbi:MAG: hypothetical protein J6A79_09600, partial [Clostridia bacterium]|nr:hypothetical protein [Clostridia bacterium]
MPHLRQNSQRWGIDFCYSISAFSGWAGMGKSLTPLFSAQHLYAAGPRVLNSLMMLYCSALIRIVTAPSPSSSAISRAVFP